VKKSLGNDGKEKVLILEITGINMQQKTLYKNTIFFLGLVSFGLISTFLSLSGIGRDYSARFNSGINNIKSAIFSNEKKPLSDEDLAIEATKTPGILKCGGVMNPELSKSDHPSVVKLAQLQEICRAGVSDEMMIFIEMPNSPIAAGRQALALSEDLKDFKKIGIKPLVVVEPVTEWGLIEFEEFGTGFYDQWLDNFFARLVNEGVTQEMMGVWIPFPEANLPYWNKTQDDPGQFGKNVSIYGRILHKYYPKTEVSVLLNAESYQSTDYNWEKGTYDSLIPYIETLDKGLVTSFGIQGFPWRSPKSQEVPLYIYDPVEFINPELAIEAANFLGVKKIWINTGTFRAKFANDADEMVVEYASVRETILTEILEQAKIMQGKGFEVSINLFAENKVETPEATDWSYWGVNEKETDVHTTILLDFLSSATRENIEVHIFDKQK